MKLNTGVCAMFKPNQILSHDFVFGLDYLNVTVKLHVTYLKKVWKLILELVIWKSVSFITFEK